jgi:hypothetical protein
VAVVLRLVPGGGPDVQRLELGLTTDRMPYGGWPARDAAGKSIAGALLVQTRYERDVALAAVARVGAARVRASVRADTGFALAYLGGLALLAAGTLRLWRARPRAGEA